MLNQQAPIIESYIQTTMAEEKLTFEKWDNFQIERYLSWVKPEVFSLGNTNG